MNKATKTYQDISKSPGIQKKSGRQVASICYQLGGLLNWPQSRHVTVHLSADAAETSSQFSMCLGFPPISCDGNHVPELQQIPRRWWLWCIDHTAVAQGMHAYTWVHVSSSPISLTSLPAPILANPLFRSRGIDLIGCFDKDAILQRRSWTHEVFKLGGWTYGYHARTNNFKYACWEFLR